MTSPIPVDEHALLAREIGAAGSILLRNEGELLPLDPTRVSSIVVLGEWAGQASTGGGGSSRVNPIRAVTPADAISRRLAESDVDLTIDSEADPETAAQLAGEADVAVVIVGKVETESIDRENMSLPDDQDALIAAVAAANPRTIVVIHTGSPILMPWVDEVGAIVEGWYPGVDGKVYCEEGLEVGYRWYQAQGITPLFPFGFGLSYTTFDLGDLSVDTPSVQPGDSVGLQVRIMNTGEREGAEVVQAYVAYPADLDEPPKQLRAFQKVTLEPGESQALGLTLGPRAFAVWDTDSNDWIVNRGTSEIFVGTSSDDTPLRASVIVE